jgi:type VI secretion system secreted protein VgrG
MATQLQQAARIASFDTPLGKDKLVLIQYRAIEAVGELFEFNIEALSEDENIDFDKALGQSCTLKINAYDGKQRIFNGLMTEAQWIGKVDVFYRYRVVLRPWLYLLGCMADCRIFLQMTVIDILKEVFTKAGFNDFSVRTNGNYEQIEYCVQYRETHLAFVSRLMELYGIFYFFEHTDGKHTLVLADSRSSLKPISDLSTVPYVPLTRAEMRPGQHLYDWVSVRSFRTGKVQLNDYDYLKPTKNLLAPAEGSEKYSHSKLEVYDYPGKYTEKDKGENLARFRLEAEQALDHRRHINGDAASLYPGGLTTVEKHPTDSENMQYFVARANHRFSSHHYRSISKSDMGNLPVRDIAPDGTIVDQDQVYYGVYEFQPADRPYRMPPVTPKPRVFGIETAVVVGKQGEDSEEISTDEYGRIWVKFFWDRDPHKTCPIRVSQSWASKQWGTQFIPRLGMEVVVEFLEGDPDRPLVTGCVYNGDNKVPYDLPGQKTQSGTKSDSSKGHNGYNEFMFEDQKGGEFIRMHAEKDHLVTVNANQTGSVGVVAPDNPYPGGDQTWTVGNNRSWTIQKGNDTLDIQLGSQTVSIDAGNQSTTVAMNISTTADISITLTVGPSVVNITPGSISLTSPVINLTAEGAINIMGAAVNIGAVLNTPELNAGAATISGIPM